MLSKHHRRILNRYGGSSLDITRKTLKKLPSRHCKAKLTCMGKYLIGGEELRVCLIRLQFFRT